MDILSESLYDSFVSTLDPTVDGDIRLLLKCFEHALLNFKLYGEEL